jgi:excisionase family DNA binding protein
MTENSNNLLNITQAAKLKNVTRQAIYQAIKSKKLKALRNEFKWIINLNDLEDYEKSKYSRAYSTHKGELIFDKEKGLFSCIETSKICNVPVQTIYHAIHTGKLKAKRTRRSFVIHKDDIECYKNQNKIA